jgi:hypothetical protein
MKVSYLLFALAFIAFGCKKGRICECNTTWKFQYSSGNGYDTRIFPSESKPYAKAMTKRQALNACKHESATIQTSFEDLITDHGAHPLKAGEKIETECILH